MNLVLCAVFLIIAILLMTLLFNGIVYLFIFIKTYLVSFYFISFIVLQFLAFIIPKDNRFFYFILSIASSFITYCFDIHPVWTIFIYVFWAVLAYISSGIHEKSTQNTNKTQKISSKKSKPGKDEYYSAGLRCWKKLFTTISIPPQEEKFILAGRRGESFLKTYIASHEKFKSSHVFPSRRLNNLDGKGRKEIDMIIVTDRKIYVIECKNWSGQLHINGDTWVHTNIIRGNQTVTNEYDAASNPVNLNRKKAQLLHSILWFNGFLVEKDDIVSKVILMNKNLTVHAQAKELPDLILFQDLDPYLSQQDTQIQTSLTERIILSILNLCLDERHFPIVADTISPCLGGEARKAMIQFLQDLPSWDYIYLTSNAASDEEAAANKPFKVFQGDLLYWSDIPAFHDYINYKDIKRATVSKHKGKLTSLIMTLLGFYPLTLHITMKDGTSKKVCANPEGTVLFHEAGQKEPVSISILEIDAIEIQSR